VTRSRAGPSPPCNVLAAKSCEAVDAQSVTGTARRQTVDHPDDTDTLRRRLRDTVETCQRLATTLDTRHAVWTTHELSQSQTTPLNHPHLPDQPITKVCRIVSNVYRLRRLTVVLMVTRLRATERHLPCRVTHKCYLPPDTGERT